MAREFNGSNQYLEIGSAPVTAAPLTLAAWAYFDTLGSGREVMCLNDASATVQTFRLVYSHGALAMAAIAQDGSTGQANSSTTPSTGTWHHCCAVFSSTTSRTAYLDGGNSGSNATSISPSGIDRSNIAAFRNGTDPVVLHLDGRVAEAAIWSAALSAAEVASLGDGFAPPLIRPDALVAYWPLIRDGDKDRIGGFDLTAVNTPTVGSHPPIIYPAPQTVTVPAAAAVGSQGPLIGGRLVGGHLVRGGVLVR